jgi:hypothetical protein
VVELPRTFSLGGGALIPDRSYQFVRFIEGLLVAVRMTTVNATMLNPSKVILLPILMAFLAAPWCGSEVGR